MKKYMLIFAVIALIATACDCDDHSDKSSNNSNAVVADQVTTLSMATFDDKVGDYVGKKIKIEGTVDHICSHGGQKLFLVSEDSDARIKITPDEEIAAFNAKLEGDKLVITGIVEEQIIDEAYLREWEEEIRANYDASTAKEEAVEGCEFSEEPEEMNKVHNLRNMIKESGSDHLSFYSILCTNYDVVEDVATPDAHEAH